MTMEERVSNLEHRMEKAELADIKRAEQNERILTLLDGPEIDQLDVDAAPQRDHTQGMVYIQQEQSRVQQEQGRAILRIDQKLENGIKVRQRISLTPPVTAAIITACGMIVAAGIGVLLTL